MNEKVISQEMVDKTVALVYNIHTKATYRSALTPFVGVGLDAPSIQGVIDQWGDVAKSTVNVRKVALQRMVGYALASGLCQDNITDRVVFPDGRPEKIRYALGDAEVESLLGAARNDRELLLLVVLLDTGMRVGNACQVSMSDLKLESFQLVGKGNVPITIHTTETIRGLASRFDDEDSLTNGKAYPRKIHRAVSSIGRRVGLDVYPHLLRHTHVTRIASASGIEIAARSVGHKSIQTTRRYRTVSEESLRRAVESVSVGGEYVSY